MKICFRVEDLRTICSGNNNLFFSDMFRLPKRDDKKSLFEPVESLTQKLGKCNLLSNFLPQIGLRRGRKRASRRGDVFFPTRKLDSDWAHYYEVNR